MSDLSVGFARVDVTPSLGTPISGYFIKRFVEGVLDTLNVSAVAVRTGGETVLIISVDTLSMQTYIMDEYRKNISEATGIPIKAIFIHCTHTHTGAYVDKKAYATVADEDEESAMNLIDEYRVFMGRRLVDAAVAAVEDLKPARMGYGVSRASGIAFLRRYKMKDGSVRTNPGVNNPDIVEPVGEFDEDVGVVRFDRENAKSVAIVNYANHADVVGGSRVSADWPGFLYRTFEQAVENTACVVLNGAEGDVNHVNVHPTKGYLNDLFMDFDDVARGYGHARHMGRVVAGAVMQVWDKVEYVDEADIKFEEITVNIPSNMPKPDEMADARRIAELHALGKDEELPYKGMMLTTMVADAQRKINLEHGPEAFPMKLIALSIGKVAFVGIPGEPFNLIGKEIKKAKNWELIVPCCLVNGSEGYFPMRDSYEQGGYEARSSNFKAGVAELIIKECVSVLDGISK